MAPPSALNLLYFHVPEGAKDGALAASSPPGVALGTADGVTAAAASATETDPDAEMDPVPAVTAPSTADDTTATVLRAATPAHTADGTSRGHKRNAASGNDDNADGSVATAAYAADTGAARSARAIDVTVDGPDVTVGDAADGTMVAHRSAGKRRGRRNSGARRTRKRVRYDGSPSHGDHDTPSSTS